MRKGWQGTYIKGTTNCGSDSGSEIGAGDNGHLLVPFFNGLSHRISGKKWLTIKENVRWRSKTQGGECLQAWKKNRSSGQRDSPAQSRRERDPQNRKGKSLEEKDGERKQTSYSPFCSFTWRWRFGANNSASVFHEPINRLVTPVILLLYCNLPQKWNEFYFALGPFNWSNGTLILHGPIGVVSRPNP